MFNIKVTKTNTFAIYLMINFDAAVYQDVYNNCLLIDFYYYIFIDVLFIKNIYLYCTFIYYYCLYDL